MIWYENETSIKAKVEVAKQLGIKGISVWRLGTIPDFEDTQTVTTRLNRVEILSKVLGK